MALLMLSITATWAGEVATFNLNGSPGVSTPSGFFTHEGNFNFNSKFNGAEYADISFTQGLKMEGSTTIKFTTAYESTVTIVQSTWSSNTIKLDGSALSVGDAAAGTGCRIYTVENVAAGNHTITRGSGESGLFYIKVEWTVPKTVYYVNTDDWTSVYVWAWDDELNNYTGGVWPGVAMTDTGETEDGHKVYSWSTTGEPTQVLFNDGSDQTADLDFVDGATYNLSGIKMNDYTVTFTTDGMESVYAYTWTGDNHQLGDWPGTPMTATGEANKWTITVNAPVAPAYIIFHNNKGEQTPDLAFVDGHDYELMLNTYTASFTTDATWEHVYAYTWTGSNHELGDWPGTKLEATAGVYNLSFKAFSAPLQILFHNNDGTQTNDQPFVDGKAYKYITAAPLFAIASTQAAIAAGTTVDIKDAEEDKVATLTYGFEGGAEFAAASNGNGSNDDYAVMEYMTAGNGENGTATSGTCYIINPLYDGTITVGVRLNGDKNFYILEDGEAMEGYNGITIATVTNTSYSFPVKGGSTYKIYCTGSKLGFYGFDYTGYTKTYTVAGTKDLTGTPDDWDIVDANNMVLNGETGLYEWTANDIIVSETAIPEFKVVKDNTDWYPVGGPETSWKITLGAISAAVAGKYDIKVTFNAATKVIGVSATKTYEALEIGEKGWATTVTNSPLNFSAAGIEAYTATLSGTTVTLTKVNDVQAETGLVLKGAEDTHYIPVAASSSTDKGSLMFSSTLGYNMWGSHSFYGLTVKDGKAKFAKLTYVEGKTIPARKAFLLVEDGLGASANELNVVFDNESGDVTGINTLNAERNTLNGEMYNLAGQKVNKSYKGIVITNGNKVMMK